MNLMETRIRGYNHAQKSHTHRNQGPRGTDGQGGEAIYRTPFEGWILLENYLR